MSRKANPAVIGAFVLAALAAAITTVFVLGTARFLTRTTRYVIFFEGSMSGLDVGAPVEYRGVRVGQVADITIQYNSRSGEVLIPVYVALEDDKFRNISSRQGRADIDAIIRGVRAQLQSISFVTGKMRVMLVDKPDTPARLVGGDPDTPEIAAIPTLVENISQSIEKLPLAQIIGNLDSSLHQIAVFASSGELTNAVAHLNGALAEIETLSRRLNEQMPGLLATVQRNGESFQKVQADLDALLAEVRGVLASGSPERQQLVTSLRSVEEAADSLRNLADYLQMHPEVLIKGKPEDKK